MSDPYSQTVDAAIETARRPNAGITTLSPSQKAFYRHVVYNDPWIFNQVVCGLTRLVPRIHQPLTYIFAGRADLLAWFLQTTREESLVIDQVRSELRRLGVDWRDFDITAWKWISGEAERKFRKAISYVVQCLARGFFKSSNMIATQTWRVTHNPNDTLLIVHAVDPKAWLLCEQMGEFIRGNQYRFFFDDASAPEYHRFPENPKNSILQDYIHLRGRTVPHKEKNVTAGGAGSTNTGGHFNIFGIDDLNTVEQTDVERETSNAFLSRKGGLHIPGVLIDTYISATRHAVDDDFAIVTRNPRVMKIELPNEIHDEQITLSRMFAVGRPTVPEIQNAEAIAEIKDDYHKDPDKGDLAYLQDYALVPDAETAALFPPAIVDAREWEWHKDAKTGRLWIVRQQRGERDASGRRTRIYERDGKDYVLGANERPDGRSIPRLVKIDPYSMMRAMGVDPAVSLTGDDWAVSVTAIDHQQFKYELETLAGKGVEFLFEAILMLEEKWKVRRIGVEKAGQQELFVLMMQKDDRFRRIVHKIKADQANATAKPTHIRNQVSAPLISGELLLSPDSAGVRAEMRLYKPLSPKTKDNRLDAIRISLSQLTALGSGITEEQRVSAERAAAYERQEAFDPQTHIQTNTNWLEAMW